MIWHECCFILIQIIKNNKVFLLINGRDGKLDTSLVENDTVSLFPPVGGG
jgi:molybdopterin converting factor small subunit